MATLASPIAPGRTRSVSQPIRDGMANDFLTGLSSNYSPKPSRSSYMRSQSSNSIINKTKINQGLNSGRSNGTTTGRARSSSLMTVTEVGGDEPETVSDRVGMGTNQNSAWVNAPGAWIMHPVLIMLTKILVDAIPHITQDVSWSIVTIAYMVGSFVMFHFTTGVPHESLMTTGGAYDEYTLWEQIDAGAQYTPAKKWLTSVPIVLFLVSTHYTKYDPVLFTLNFVALVFCLFPKLPSLHRLRFHFLPSMVTDAITPLPSRPASPKPRN